MDVTNPGVAPRRSVANLPKRTPDHCITLTEARTRNVITGSIERLTFPFYVQWMATHALDSRVWQACFAGLQLACCLTCKDRNCLLSYPADLPVIATRLLHCLHSLLHWGRFLNPREWGPNSDIFLNSVSHITRSYGMEDSYMFNLLYFCNLFLEQVWDQIYCEQFLCLELTYKVFIFRFCSMCQAFCPLFSYWWSGEWAHGQFLYFAYSYEIHIGVFCNPIFH